MTLYKQVMNRGPIAILLMMLIVIGVGECWAAERSRAVSPPDSLQGALRDLAGADEVKRDAAARLLMEEGHESLLPALEEIRAGGDRALRQTIKPIVDMVRNRGKLNSPDPDVRRSAANDLGSSGRLVAVPWLEGALNGETHRWVRYTMEESVHLLRLLSDDHAAKGAAATALGKLRSQNAIPSLKELVQSANEPAATEEQKRIGQTAAEAIERIESWGVWATAIETIFRGISLSSILLIMSLGLAVVFGLMGVINMAHGELMMVGAYTAFVVQECFKAYMPAEWFDHYFLAAMPAAFLVAAACRPGPGGDDYPISVRPSARNHVGDVGSESGIHTNRPRLFR